MLTWFGIFSALLAANATWALTVAIVKTALDLSERRAARERWKRVKAYLSEVGTLANPTREQMEDIASKYGFRITESGNVVEKETSPE